MSTNHSAVAVVVAADTLVEHDFAVDYNPIEMLQLVVLLVADSKMKLFFNIIDCF
jgi:hypothetical protein